MDGCSACSAGRVQLASSLERGGRMPMTLLCLLFALCCGAAALQVYVLVGRAIGRPDGSGDER